MVRFHGVFAPNAKLRAEVVPKKAPRNIAQHSPRELGDAEQTHLFGDEGAGVRVAPGGWGRFGKDCADQAGETRGQGLAACADADAYFSAAPTFRFMVPSRPRDPLALTETLCSSPKRISMGGSK